MWYCWCTSCVGGDVVKYNHSLTVLLCSYLILLQYTSLYHIVLLARSPEYPQRIRVASVFELFFDCSLFFGSKFSHFSSPHLLFYSTIQYIKVQKMRKFADKEQSRKIKEQRTVQKLRPPYPQVSSRETRAN